VQDDGLEASASTGGLALTIGEFSRVTGLPPSVLRDWETHGIVAPVRTGSHRRYTAKDLDRVKAAQRLRSRNINPAAIAEILGPCDASPVKEDHRVKVGPTLRDARRVARMTLVEVSTRVDCSTSHLSSIERGAATPSMSLLHRIAEVYGIDVAMLFGGISDTGPMRTSANDSAPFVTEQGLLKVWGVARTSSICADIYEAEPGAGSEGPYRHEGEEYVFVLSGAFEISLEGYGTYELREGEALSFSSRVPHEWRNNCKAPVRMLWTNTHPELMASSCVSPNSP
jgi:DNA-binding transcriptional MerR regulator/mannose-6-phosphate isomerase-like protein (cupin superfamily)